MKRFDLPQLVKFHKRLQTHSEHLKNTGGAIGEEELPFWLKFLREVQNYCNGVDFNHASLKAYSIRYDLEASPDLFTGVSLAAHLDGLREDIDICMFAHSFIQVTGKLRDYLNPKALFGESALEAFPKSAEDVQDAGDCIAVDLNTAAVFHLMHVVEWGLRAFAIDVGLADVVTDRAKGKTVPLEYAQWEQILNQLPDKIDEKIEAIPRGEAKQKAQEFYHSAHSDIRGFKDAWRNHVMHTRRSYTREDALAVWSHVQRFMQSLAAYGIKG